MKTSIIQSTKCPICGERYSSITDCPHQSYDIKRWARTLTIEQKVAIKLKNSDELKLLKHYKEA